MPAWRERGYDVDDNVVAAAVKLLLSLLPDFVISN